MPSTNTVFSASFVCALSLVMSHSATADFVRTINCPQQSVQNAVNSSLSIIPLRLHVTSQCDENVTITRDDVTIEGGPAGAINGTINIIGARRIVIRNMTLTGPGAGVHVTDGGTASVEDSKIEENDTDGVAVTNGAVVKLLNNVISENGKNAGPDEGRGVLVNDSGSAEIVGNTVEDNRSDGIGVFNDSFARVIRNQIRRNGRLSVFEAGVQISRAQARGNGNIYEDNPYAAIEVFNFGAYRTGSFLNAEDSPDNGLPFEEIKAAPTGVAVDIGQASFVDLRQVNVSGTIFVGRQSMLQMRGDNIGPNVQCSEVDFISVFGFNSGARLRDTKVNVGTSGGPIEDGGCPFP